METFNLILEFLKVLLSGPSVALIGVGILVAVFRPNIAALIDRIKTVKFPGGELATRAQKPRDEEGSDKPPPTPPPAPPALPGHMQLSPEQQRMLEGLFHAERQKAILWEFRYLNFFLVYQTQQVLDWLATQANGSTSRSLYEASWLLAIPNPQDRQAIVTALHAHELIAVNGEHIQLTEKARGYLTWRGKLPPPPTP